MIHAKEEDKNNNTFVRNQGRQNRNSGPRILYPAQISFKEEGEIKIHKSWTMHCWKTFIRRNIKGSSSTKRSVIPDRSSDLHEDMRSTGHGTEESKNKINFFLIFMALKVNRPSKGKIAIVHDMFIG